MPAVRIEDLFSSNDDKERTHQNQKIPCTACQKCGDERIGKLVQKKIDKILDRAAKGKLKTGMVVL